MREVRGHEDVAAIAEKSPVVIWGMGSGGYRLLQEIRVNKVKNVYVYDRNEMMTKDIDERITLERMQCESDRLSFVITSYNDRVVDEIYGQIQSYNKDAKIYRYVPKDWQYMNKVLREEGFFNGVERCKPLDNLSAKKLMEQRINDSRPFLCARWGGNEGFAVYAEASGLYNDAERMPLKRDAGFWPLDRHSLHRFAEYSIGAAKEIDILIAGVWCERVEELYRMYSPNAVLTKDAIMQPFWSDVSWTGALKGKKVLVIHPFVKIMEKQYEYRDRLFSSPDILPEFELMTYPAVQSIGGHPEFESWFDALERMERDISHIDFDVALIGCGAYGMPLGAFIKSKMHKKAIHMGGALQLLFGIKGRRWEGFGEVEGDGYGYDIKLYNEYWVRPTDDLKPKGYKDVEGGCYW